MAEDQEFTLPPLEERPLVTFALFAYNQEKYIREAVEGAFAQTYEPLEIILSDDSSTDGTFAIMQAMVKEYDGPHHVKLVKTQSNLGTFSHVMSSFRRSQGALLVLAAGDDISLPNRVATLVSVWMHTGAWGLSSKFDRIDEVGQVLEKDCYLPMSNHKIRSYFPKEPGISLIHGATSAYDRRAFQSVGKYSDLWILQEDAVFSFVLNLNNKKIENLNFSLVLYRSHDRSISNNHKNGISLSFHCILEEERRAARYAKSFHDLNILYLRILRNSNEPATSHSSANRELIIKDLRYYRMKNVWIESGISSRLAFLFSSISSGHRKWLTARLLGVRFFCYLKYLFKLF